MRVLIDLPDDDINWLDHKAAELGVSRAALVREVVATYRAGTGRKGIERDFAHVRAELAGALDRLRG